MLQTAAGGLTAPLLNATDDYSYRRFNLDGFLTVWQWTGAEADRAYLQVFRTGIMEAVDAYYINEVRSVDGRSVPASQWKQDHELAFLRGVKRSFALFQLLGVVPPIVAFTTLTGLQNCQLNLPGYSGDHYPFLSDVMLLPDVLIEDFGVPAHQLMRPVFDAIWNAGGFPRCLNYSDNGECKRKY